MPQSQQYPRQTKGQRTTQEHQPTTKQPPQYITEQDTQKYTANESAVGSGPAAKPYRKHRPTTPTTNRKTSEPSKPREIHEPNDESPTSAYPSKSRQDTQPLTGTAQPSTQEPLTPLPLRTKTNSPGNPTDTSRENETHHVRQ